MKTIQPNDKTVYRGKPDKLSHEKQLEWEQKLMVSSNNCVSVFYYYNNNNSSSAKLLLPASCSSFI